MGDTSPKTDELVAALRDNLRLADDNAALLRQNGDLRVEVERQKAELERRAARIAELERQLAEALAPPGGKALLEQKAG